MSKSKSYIFLFGIPILIFLFITIIVGFNGYYGQDSYEYLRFTRALYESYVQGSEAGDFGVALPVLYSVYGSVASFFSSPIFALRLVSFLSFLVAIFYFCKILQTVFPKYKSTAWIFSLVFFVLSPNVLKAGMLAMTDTLCLAFVLAGFYYSLLYWQRSNSFALLISIFCISSAFMTRYIAAPLLLIPSLITVFYFFKYRDFKWLPLVALMIGLAFLPQYLIRGEDFFSFMSDKGISLWSVQHLLQSKFERDVSQAQYDVINLIFVLKNWWHPSYILLGIPFLFFVRISDLKKQAVIVGILMTLLYAFYLGGISFQNTRYLVLSFPFILLLYFPAFNRILDKVKSTNHRLMAGVFLGILQLGMFGYLLQKLVVMNQGEKVITKMVNEKMIPNSTIYTLSFEGPLRAYTKHQTYSLLGENITELEENTYLFFNEPFTRSLLLDESVWQNFEFLKSNGDLVEMETFENGFVLYEVKK